MYGIQFVDNIKKAIGDNEIGTFVYFGVKAIACLIFGIHLYQNFFSNTLGKKRPELDWNYIYNKGFILILILGWADIYNGFINLFAWLESAVPISEPKPKEIFLRMIQESEVETKDGVLNSIKQLLTSINQFLEDPEIVVSIIINFIAGLADMIIYIYFLLQQYFFSYVLSIVSPIMLALSMFKISALGDYWTRIIKYNVIAFLMLPFFYLANTIGELVYTAGNGKKVDIIWDFGDATTASIEADPTILLLTIFIKFGLMKMSKDLLFKFLG